MASTYNTEIREREAISISLSYSLYSPLAPVSQEIIADQDGNYDVTVFCFIDTYTGPVSLTLCDDSADTVYNSHTNELGSVSFHITGTLPVDAVKKVFPIRVSAFDKQADSSLSVRRMSI